MKLTKLNVAVISRTYTRRNEFVSLLYQTKMIKE